jgi:hypothetical protein
MRGAELTAAGQHTAVRPSSARVDTVAHWLLSINTDTRGDERDARPDTTESI